MKIENSRKFKEEESITHFVEINGVVISDMDKERFTDEFIKWVESIGGSYLGITKEIEENN